MKYINIFITLAGGFLATLLGGWDLFLQVMVVMVCLDWITGLTKAWATKTLSSKIGAIGIAKTVMQFSIIAVTVAIGNILGIQLKLYVITFYIWNNIISIFENASLFVPLPSKLIAVLEQIKGDD